MLSFSLIMKIISQKSTVSPYCCLGHSCLQLAIPLREGFYALLCGDSNKVLFIVADIKIAKINGEVNTSWDHLARILIQTVL